MKTRSFSPRPRRQFLVTLALAGTGMRLRCFRAAALDAAAIAGQQPVPLWGRFETALSHAQAWNNPFTDGSLEAIFTAPSGRHRKVFGFYDGEFTWRLRFMPDETGLWRYEAKFSDASATVTGTFPCVPGSLHGPWRVYKRNPYWFEHADGTPVLVRAFHLWRVDALDEAVLDQTLDFLQSQGFNAIVGPHLIPPDRLPWARQPQGTPDFSRFNLPLWRRLDRALEKLARRGMVLIPFNLFGGTNGMPKIPRPAEEELFLRYWVARWAGFWNATFQPTSEWEEGFSETHILRVGARLRELDAGQHLVSVHALHAGTPAVQQAPWYDYHTVQDKLTDQNFARYWSSTRRLHAQVPKPILAHEHLWEGNRYQKEAGLDPELFRRAAWTLSLAGAAINYADEVAPPRRHSREEESFSNHGAAMKPLGLTYPYLKHLGDFLASLPWWEMKPAEHIATPGFCLENPAKEYVIYLPNGNTTALVLPEGNYQARWLNPRTGELSKPFPLAGGAPKPLQSPDGNDWTVWIKK